MRILDLFAGIGGFSLAAHWMGWETAAFVEWDSFCQKVLRKNFPTTPIYGDIKEFRYDRKQQYIGPVDLICGGFPCQPFSTAGKRNGTNDDRYLWPEMLRVIREVKPAWVVGENVAGLLSMDGGAVFEQVCTSLEDEGYTVQAFVLPAISVGAPHRRDRVWIVAHSNSSRGERSVVQQPSVYTGPTQSSQRPSSNPECAGLERGIWIQGAKGLVEGYSVVGNPNKSGLEGHRGHGKRTDEWPVRSSDWQDHWHEVALATCYDGMDDGIPVELDQHGNRDNRAKRLKALGNAIVPQVAYEVFLAIQHQIDNQ